MTGKENGEQKELQELRKKIFLTGYKGGMAHLASCYSSLEILYALYKKKTLRYDESNPEWEDRDRFILSKGHAGLALYGVMMAAGLLSEEEYDSYLQPGSHIGGEPCMRDSKWVEATTGSLGHGLSMAVGMALALKANHSPAKVYVLLGDGECEEGTVWEAAMSAAAFGLDNLVAILDCNQIQKMDFVDKTIGMVNWEEKWTSFGWSVGTVDGHDVSAVEKTLCVPNEPGKPRFVIAHTIKGKGVSIMENNPNWHFKLPGKKERKVFMEELGISEEELF
ncbi:MAG: transketolase [Lachnospiraceae bacterium]|nr:transketolase [Lachnospiraceae bacterium]